jgi:hypothetical protein
MKIIEFMLTEGPYLLNILFVDLEAIRETYVRPDALGCPVRVRCSACCFA